MPLQLRRPLFKSFPRLGNSSPLFYCPSCSIRRTISTRPATAGRPPTRFEQYRLPSRKSRPITTSLAIKTIRDVPSRFKELHEALEQVKNTAQEQINLSRLQLALRGLESETPVTRVAVLGLNDVSTARKLVHLLLADPLKSREDWEPAFDDYGEDISRGLLIRYGETSETIPNDLLPTLSIPSSILKKNNLEILITTLGSDAEPSGAHITADAFLVPTVTIRFSHSGHHSVIRFPVHRTLVCGKGINDLLAYAGLIARVDLKRDAASVRGVVDLSVSDDGKATSRVTLVNIQQAEEALDKFRQSVKNARVYERGWNNSGVQPILDWLLSSKPKMSGLDPALETLIESLLDSVEERLLSREAKEKSEQVSKSVPASVRQKLDVSVRLWAERAHTELRDSLDEGFASKRWKGLAWWKLFWGVDDVGMITSEIMQKHYLVQAEKEVIWTAGKLQQAGLQEQEKPVAPISQAAGTSPDSRLHGTSLNLSSKIGNPPWPDQISTSRAQLRNTTVPSLQALAQNLVLFSISTTALTSALSVLTYLAFPATTVYEAATFAAVGLVWSLRRQQKRWADARKFWETEVREAGRVSLRETENSLQTAVNHGGRSEPNVRQSNARLALQRASQALQTLKKT